MKTLNTYINEKLVLNKDTFKKPEYKYFPETTNELYNIIKSLYNNENHNDEINLNSINVSNIKSMVYLFNYLKISDLKKIDISGWDLSGINNIHGLFAGCSKVTDIYLPEYINENIKDISFLFHGCGKLKQIHNFNALYTNNVTTMENMFALCGSIEYIDVTNFKTDSLENTEAMFAHCYQLKKIDGLSYWNADNITNMSDMFCYCEKLQHIDDISDWCPKNLKKMRCMFLSCKDLKDVIDLTKWNIQTDKTDICDWNCLVSDKKNFKL